MVEFGHQQTLSLLIVLPFGDVEDGSHDMEAFPILVSESLATIEQPAGFSVGTNDLELDLAAPGIGDVAFHVLADHVAVVGMDEMQRALERQRIVALDA